MAEKNYAAPSDLAIKELKGCKRRLRNFPSYRDAYALADAYYKGGALNAAKVYARVWYMLLAIRNGDKDPTSLMLGTGIASDADDDEFVWMYG